MEGKLGTIQIVKFTFSQPEGMLVMPTSILNAILAN